MLFNLIFVILQPLLGLSLLTYLYRPRLRRDITVWRSCMGLFRPCSISRVPAWFPLLLSILCYNMCREYAQAEIEFFEKVGI